MPFIRSSSSHAPSRSPLKTPALIAYCVCAPELETVSAVGSDDVSTPGFSGDLAERTPLSSTADTPSILSVTSFSPSLASSSLTAAPDTLRMSELE